MARFYAAEGQFWLDDEPLLIQAGEFHYFRTPEEDWAHRLGLLKTAGFNAVAAYIPWLWHQVEENASDFDGHSHPMRNLAGFLDLAAEMGLYIIARPGPYIMAETINEGVPPWLFRNYPDTAFVDQSQTVQNIASYMHPDFLACVTKWYQVVFKVLSPRQISRSGKIIMIQLDNEMGMPHWVRNIFDTNFDTLNKFANFLVRHYGPSLADRYPADDLVTFLRDGILNPTAEFGALITADYRHFYREYLCHYTSFLWTVARANGMEVPPIVNIHGFMNGGKTFPIGISQLVKAMEIPGMISATDVYPIIIGESNFHQLLLVNETTKSVQNKEQPLFSVEFQAGGNNDFGSGQSSFYDLHSRLCISNGMRAINHYLFFDGENDPVLSPVKRHDWGHPVRKDGTLRSHYHRYPELSRVLESYGRSLTLSQPKNVITIGFQLDYFMTEVNNAFTKEVTKILTHQREVVLCDMIARGLALSHRPFDALELERGTLDPARTPVLWVMMDKQCSPTVQQKLLDYVNQGGRLLLAGRICLEDFDHKPCTILKDGLGLETIQSDEPFAAGNIDAFEYQGIPVRFVETYVGRFDEDFASRGDEVVGFVKNIGSGRILVFGAAMAANTLDDLDVVNQMAEKMDCQPLFTLDTWADVRISQSETGSFLFINNYQDDPIETSIRCDNQRLFGDSSINLPARRGLILPLEWRLNEDVIIHYATAEIVAFEEDGPTIILRTEPAQFTAELSTTAYRCENTAVVNLENGRVKIESKNGEIVLRRQ